jgi:hypothetical protein
MASSTLTAESATDIFHTYTHPPSPLADLDI